MKYVAPAGIWNLQQPDKKKRLTTDKSTDYNATKSANYRIMITRP